MAFSCSLIQTSSSLNDFSGKQNRSFEILYQIVKRIAMAVTGTELCGKKLVADRASDFLTMYWYTGYWK